MTLRSDRMPSQVSQATGSSPGSTGGSRTPPVATARWLLRFTTDMEAMGFTDEVIAHCLPVVLAHQLKADDLLTESED